MASNWDYFYRLKKAIEASQKAREGLVKAFVDVMRTGRELRELMKVINFPTTQDASIQTVVTKTETETMQTPQNEGIDVSIQTNLVEETEFTSRDIPDIEEVEEMSRYDHQPSSETDEIREFYFKTTQRICYNPSSISHFERYEETRNPRQIIDICFNCQSTSHRYGDCPYPTLRSFCFQCGLPEVTMKNCPRCIPGWKADSSNRPGITNNVLRNRFRRKAMKERYRLRRKASQYSRPKGGRPTVRERRRF